MNKSRDSLPDIDTGKGYTVSARLNFTVPLANYAQRTVVASDGARLAVRDYGASGANDMTTPDAHARDLVAAIPGAMHLQLPAAGHMLLLDAPHRQYRNQPGHGPTPLSWVDCEGVGDTLRFAFVADPGGLLTVSKAGRVNLIHGYRRWNADFASLKTVPK